MNMIQSSRHQTLAFTTGLLLSLLLTYASVEAQTFRGQASLVETPTPLLVSITSSPNAALLRVRYDAHNQVPVHVQIRSRQGTILYDEWKRQSTYVGDFDLTAWPAGLYTINLNTSTTQYKKMIRLESQSPVTATIVEEQPCVATVDKQSL